MLIDKTFGNVERFAVVVTDIERVLSDSGGEYEFGNVKFSILSKIIGNDMIAHLYPCYLSVRDFLRDHAQDALLDPHGDCEALFKEIKSTFWQLRDDGRGENPSFDKNDAAAWKAVIQKEKQYHPLQLPHDGAEFFDGWYVFVVRNAEACRVIFTDTLTYDERRRVHCVFLEWEEIALPLQEFCEWYETYEAESRKAPPQERKKKRK